MEERQRRDHRREGGCVTAMVRARAALDRLGALPDPMPREQAEWLGAAEQFVRAAVDCELLGPAAAQLAACRAQVEAAPWRRWREQTDRSYRLMIHLAVRMGE